MFVSSLDLTGEVEVQILHRDDEYLFSVPIGSDRELNVTYSVLVVLAPLTGYADVPGFELMFQLVEASLDGSRVTPFWDGADTRRFLPEPGLRRRVFHLICLGVATLVDAAQPRLVHMTTHTPNLPPQALVKFDRICAMFRKRGFTAGKADVWHGQHIWMMER